MPELPEVETIRRGLSKVIVGRKIEKFESLDSKVIQFAEKDVEGLFISNIERRAKILIFYLSGSPPAAFSNVVISTEAEKSSDKRSLDYARDDTGERILKQVQDDVTGKVLLCHLKMTGQLIWEEKPGTSDFQLKKVKSPSISLRAAAQRVVGGHPSPDWVNKLPNAYTRAIFHFDDKSVLFFNDLRRFGYMKLYDKSELKSIKELAKLGPEPFSPDFTIEYLMRRAAKIPNRKIKQFITDQEIISGVGNIYVDEALFYAGILPTRKVADIQLSEWKRIIQSIVKALEMGLKYGGSSEDTYVDAFGNQGTMNSHTKVYRHTGEPCGECGTKVVRITLGGRGTHYCPVCQK